MEIKMIALALLVGRLIAVFYLFKVLKIQIKLLRMKVAPELWDFRRTLHYMTIIILLGNVLPIVLDVSFLLFNERPFWLGVSYAVSNVITAVVAAILIHKLYRLANNTKKVIDLEREYLKTKKVKGTK